jgi:hypothetical protein
MGIRMQYVRRIRPPERRHVHELTVSDRKMHNLVCEECDAHVTWVTQQVHEGRGGRTYEGRFARLMPGIQHGPSCPYDLDNAILRLVGESVCADVPGNILVQDGKKVELRLHVLDEAERVASGAVGTMGNDQTSITGARYVTTKQKLASYLKTATGVARLWERITDDAQGQLKERIIIISDGKPIEWCDFFYDEKRYTALCAVGSGRGPTHLVAIVVVPKSKNHKDNRWHLQCYKQTDPKDDSVCIPHLYISDNEIASLLHPERAFLLVARVAIRTVRPPPDGDIPKLPPANVSSKRKESSTTFHNIVVNVHHANQVYDLGPVWVQKQAATG